jgi:hypothetical protein
MADEIKFFMDEHVPLAVTRGLRRRGVDVLTAKEHPSATWCADSFSSTTFSPPKKCADTSNTFNPTIRADLERYKKARRLKKQTADG